MTITRWAKIGFMLPNLFMIGCGEGVPPVKKVDLVPVSGTVKFGGQPTAGIRVTFVPIDETPGQGAVATTDESGQYELIQTADNKPGVAAGTYRVEFYKSTGEAPKAGPPHADLMGTDNAIPESWRGKPTGQGGVAPQNRATVPAGGGTIDFDIPAQ